MPIYVQGNLVPRELSETLPNYRYSIFGDIKFTGTLTYSNGFVHVADFVFMGVNGRAFFHPSVPSRQGIEKKLEDSPNYMEGYMRLLHGILRHQPTDQRFTSMLTLPLHGYKRELGGDSGEASIVGSIARYILVRLNPGRVYVVTADTLTHRETEIRRGELARADFRKPTISNPQTFE